MIELVDWETFCPKSKNDEHCICFYEPAERYNGDTTLRCCECKREPTKRKNYNGHRKN